MAGANYMGGKRNAMKARAKDTVGRQHKGHFGRQRLDVLAKGVCAGRTAARVGALSCGDRPPVEIDLVHARKGAQLDLDDENNSYCFIPSPVNIAPSTPRASAQKRARRTTEAHTSSSAVSRSKVLDALDMSEPLFLRRLMDQIIAMPNLACLKQRNPARSPSSSPQDICVMTKRKTSTPKREKHRKPPVGDENEDPNEGSHRESSFANEEQTSSRYPRFNIRFCTPPQKTRTYTKRSPKAACFLVQDDIHDTPSEAPLHEKQREDEVEWAINESDLPEFDSAEIDHTALSSSLWSPVCSQYSSRTSLHSDVQDDEAYMDGDDDVEFPLDHLSPMHHEDFIQMSMEESPADESDYLPRSIVFGFNGSKGFTSTVYGDLFQQEDPWNMIGVILGLPQVDTANALTGEPRVGLSVESTSQMDVDDWSSKLKEYYEGCEGEFADGCPADDMNCEPEVRIMTGLIQDRTLPDDPQASGRCSDQSGDQIIPECSLSFHEDDLDAVDSEGETAEYNVAIVESSAHHDVEGVHITTGTSPGRSVTGAAQDLGYYEASDEGNGDGGQILGTPDLREVDGRYLGPSLFEAFGDSGGEFSD